MGKSISSFEVNRPSPEKYSQGEEEYRQIQASIHRAHDFQERIQRLDTILAPPMPHNEPVLALLPCNTDPWPPGYHSLVDSLIPINLVEPSHHPDQTFDPTVSNVRFVSSPPMSSMAGGKPSTPVVSVPFNVGGEPSAQSTLPDNGFSTHNRQTSTACTS